MTALEDRSLAELVDQVERQDARGFLGPGVAVARLAQFERWHAGNPVAVGVIRPARMRALMRDAERAGDVLARATHIVRTGRDVAS